MVVNKIVALLESAVNLERVQEHRIVFLVDNEEVAQLVFHDAETRKEGLNLGLAHEHEIKYLLVRKLSNGLGSKIGGFAYVETDKDIEFFANQMVEFLHMDEEIINRFTIRYSEYK